MVRMCDTPGEHSRRIAERDWRDGRDEVESNLSTSRLSRMSRASPPRSVALADFFSILLTRVTEPIMHRHIHDENRTDPATMPCS